MSTETSLPRDANSTAMQLVPSKTALSTTVSDDISSALDITLNAATTFIEVNALEEGVFLRYASTASSASGGHDEYIIANNVRNYIPPEGTTVISVIEDGSGAKVRIIEK